MTKNTVNETERMVVTRVFDAPRALVWNAWTGPKYVMQWWGPKVFTAPFARSISVWRFAKCLERFGGPDRDRTDDLFHAMENQ
jgi:uncharacterized protein YndB with AHSA1/START domain